MATINDVVNSQLARVMGNHGAPLRALAEKEAADQALANRIKFAQMQDASETARAITLLNAREKFSAAEGEKNRKAQRENIEAQADAYTKRLTAADKQKELARLRAMGIEIKGDTIDEQIADGLKKQANGDYPKARGAVGIYKDFEKRISKIDSDISAAEEEDSRYIKSTASLLAKQQAAESLKMTMSAKELEAIGNNVSPDSIRNAAKIPQKRRAELLQALNDGSVAVQPQMEAMLLSDKLDRPTATKAKALRNEKLKAETEFMRFQSSEPGRLAVDRMAFERSEKPMALDTQPDDRAPAGIDTAKAILGQLNSGAKFQPVAGEVRQRDEQLMAEPVKSATPASTTAGTASPLMDSPGYAYAGQRNLPRMQLQFPSIPTTDSIRNSVGQFFDPLRRAGDAVGNFLNPVYGSPSPQERARIADLFGQDAPDLLPDVAKLVEANGMDRSQQVETYKAVLNGDPSAVERMKAALDFVRQSKYSPDFMPVSTPELTAP